MSGDHGFVDQLDDDTLFNEVRKFKPDAGPVVDSTRSLYRRILRKSLDGPHGMDLNSSSTSSQSQSQSPGGREDEFEVLEELPAEEAEPAVPVSSNTRASRGRVSTASVFSEAASPNPDLRKRHNRQVSFDDNVEWVQNDPEEEAPVTLSFFVKAVLIGAFICLIVTLFLIQWINSIADEEEKNQPLPDTSSFTSGGDSGSGSLPKSQ